jgi:serine/threonine-protein kinase
MAELFLGVSRGAEGFEKPVAIKRILPHLAKDVDIARMFLAEARLATHLHHQNIATVHDVGSSPEGLFLVMELVNGWDLGMLLRHASRRGRRFPPHLVAFIGAQTLAGLIHAYRRLHNGKPVMTAHRDISPSNLLVSREGEVKVTDFGIARLEGMSVGTQPGTFKGKLPYAAPETLLGDPATAASDQFALGIVLYELLTGQHPFGEGLSPTAIAHAIPTREPTPLPADLPAPLAAVVMRALAKLPQARFPRPEDMAEALARYLSQAGEPATSQSLAAFLGELNLPPTLLELGEQDDTAASAKDATAQTLRYQQLLPTRPVDPPSFELDSDPWVAFPGGPALDANGQLVGGSAPAPASRAAPASAQAPAPVPPAEPMSPSILSAAEDLYTAAQSPRPVIDTASEEPLELAERAPRQGADAFALADAEAARLRRRRLLSRVAMTLALLVIVGGAGVLVMRSGLRVPDVLAWLPFRARQTLVSIQSQPEGATVTVGDTVLGTTPLVMDNTYPPGQEIPLKVTLPGYKPWKGTFTGGQPESLDIRLRR